MQAEKQAVFAEETENDNKWNRFPKYSFAKLSLLLNLIHLL